MKKNIILFLVFTSLIHFTFSQGFKGGLLLGPTVTQVTGDKLAGYDKLGVMGGVYTEYPFNDRTTGRLEMYYIQKGSRHIPSDVDYNKYVMSLQYVEVPIIYQYRFYKKFSFQTGLSFAYLFSSKEKDQNGTINSDGRIPFRKYDFSILGGLTYNINDKWVVGGRYSYSILYIREKPDFENISYHNRRQFNDVVQISMYYAF